jgi:hypothetical protein
MFRVFTLYRSILFVRKGYVFLDLLLCTAMLYYYNEICIHYLYKRWLARAQRVSTK